MACMANSAPAPVQIENDRLYNIIQLTQKNVTASHERGNSTGESSSASDSDYPDRSRGLNGLSSAELMRKLENSQSRLQEDMSKLTRDAASLQALSGAR